MANHIYLDLILISIGVIGCAVGSIFTTMTINRLRRRIERLERRG